MLAFEQAKQLTNRMIDWFNSSNSDAYLHGISQRFNLKIKDDFTVRISFYLMLRLIIAFIVLQLDVILVLRVAPSDNVSNVVITPTTTTNVSRCCCFCL